MKVGVVDVHDGEVGVEEFHVLFVGRELFLVGCQLVQPVVELVFGELVFAF